MKTFEFKRLDLGKIGIYLERANDKSYCTVLVPNTTVLLVTNSWPTSHLNLFAWLFSCKSRFIKILPYIILE